MSLHRRAARRDASEPGIVTAFREGGASVTQLSAKGIPDLLVGFLGETYLVECKTDNAGLTEDQMRFREAWRGKPPVDVRTPAQARRWLKVWAERRPTLNDVLRAEQAASARCAEDDVDVHRAAHEAATKPGEAA